VPARGCINENTYLLTSCTTTHLECHYPSGVFFVFVLCLSLIPPTASTLLLLCRALDVRQCVCAHVCVRALTCLLSPTCNWVPSTHTHTPHPPHPHTHARAKYVSQSTINFCARRRRRHTHFDWLGLQSYYPLGTRRALVVINTHAHTRFGL